MNKRILHLSCHYVFFAAALLISFCLSGCSCGSGSKEKSYYIGIDPTFYPLDLGKKEKNVYGFTRELLLEMTEHLNARFFVVKANWDNLFDGLEEHKYQAVFSAKYPYIFMKDKYNYSNIMLNTGYALTVRKNEKARSLEDMQEKLVGYIRGEESINLLEKYPDIIVKIYDSMPLLLADVNNGFLDGALVQVIKGTSFVNNLYSDTLEITPSITDHGIRLISNKENEKIIELFNKGLEKLEKDGILSKLMKKWNL